MLGLDTHHRLSRLLLSGFLALALFGEVLLAGCSYPPTPIPTPYPEDYLPTVIALTVQAMDAVSTQLPTRRPTATVSSTPRPTPTTGSTQIPTGTPTLCCATPTRTPTRTRTATPTPSMPIAGIQILKPGPASRVTSPIKVSAYLEPGSRGRVTIELLGEDGRLLVRKVMAYASGVKVHVLTDLEFEISAAAEAARLQISTEDSAGRQVSLNSVDLVLLSMGDPDINPPGDGLEPVVIRQPLENSLVQGGSLVVTGLARPTGTDPLIAELITADGKRVGTTRLIAIPAADGREHQDFSVEIPYSISASTWVRLTISERAGRIPGTTYLTSLEILLTP